MRQLTAKQKKLLDQVMLNYEPDENGKSMFGNTNSIMTTEDLPVGVWTQLREINDTEILWQEVNRYIHDWRWSRINN